LQLLSEEYDISYLAIFLHTRAVLQQELRVNLTDANQPKLWVSELSGGSTLSSSSSAFHRSLSGAHSGSLVSDSFVTAAGAPGAGSVGSVGRKRGHQIKGGDDRGRGDKVRVVERGSAVHRTTSGSGSGLGDDPDAAALKEGSGSVKIVPLSLPAHVHYVGDFTVVEAPLLAFDVSILPHLCTTLLTMMEHAHPPPPPSAAAFAPGPPPAVANDGPARPASSDAGTAGHSSSSSAATTLTSVSTAVPVPDPDMTVYWQRLQVRPSPSYPH